RIVHRVFLARRVADQERPKPRAFPPISIAHHLHREAVIKRAAESGQDGHCHRRRIAADHDALRGYVITHGRRQGIERKLWYNTWRPRIEQRRIAWKTGSSSPGELEMTRSTS